MKYLLLVFIFICNVAVADMIDSCTSMTRIAEHAHKQMWTGKTDRQIAVSIPKTWYPVPQTSVQDFDGLIKFIAYVRHHFYFDERHEVMFAIQIECYTALE